jgi:hypothetical protein
MPKLDKRQYTEGTNGKDIEEDEEYREVKYLPIV